jgi:general secretion pathway protein L
MTNQLSLALELARRFLTWWVAELAACVPSLIRSRLAPADALVLSLGSDRAALSHESAGKSRSLAELPRSAAETDGPAAVRRALRRDAALLQRFARGKLPVVIRLPAEQGVRTRVTLPAAVESDLRQALLFQIDRRTPFAVDTVHFAHRIVGRDEGAKQIDVDLTVVPRAVVADAVAAGRKLGLSASAVQVAGESSDAAPSDNLLPDQDRARRRPMTMVVRAAAAAGVLAALFAIYRPVYVAQQAADALRVRVEAAKAVADKARHMKEEVAKLTEAQRFLINGKRENPSATEVLYQLTHVLPDDTWLEQLTVKTGEVYISGYSKSASALIPLLGESGLFLEPRFRSAVMQDPAKEKERFQISAKIARRTTS